MPAPRRRLRPFALTDVVVADAFWAPRQATNRRVTLPYEYEQLKKTGRIDAFRLDWKAGADGETPHIFWDSDLAKWIEAVGTSLATHRSPRLEALADSVIDLVVSAQQPDGYLNVHFTVVEPAKRWTNLRDWHELYCAGHLMEAAVAYYAGTGKRALLDAMCRYADYIAKVFGPRKKRGYPGHEEIELALVKLYHATGNERYLKLSTYFVDERGRQPHYYDKEAKARGEAPQRFRFQSYDYNQSHLPVREQDEARGHSVRAMYLYSGMADIAAEMGDAALLAACRKLWASTAERKMFLTGGVGSSHSGEKFTADFDLPNRTAYAETCAAIGLVFFAHRMLQMEAHGRYADVMERALYNGSISGVSLDGKSFFYVNPLESDGTHHRSPWFGCACCPPNVARLIPAVGAYAYSAAPKAAYVHLYIAGSGAAEIAGQRVTLTQQTDYPWDGDVRITVGVAQPAAFDLMLRVPGWCRAHAIRVNGKAVAAAVTKGYARLCREWADGDVVELALAMPVERVVANPGVAQDAGKTALQRGPIVYCLEQCDNRADVRALVLPDAAALEVKMDRKLFGGVPVIRGAALAPATKGWKGKLYRPADDAALRPTRFTAVPYCFWDNREPGAMTVWMPRR